MAHPAADDPFGMTAGDATLLLSNADVERVLDMTVAMDALRDGYADLAQGDATYVPRIDVFAPTPRPNEVYQWGSMAGVALSAGALAVRVKSDVVTWPDGARQEKYAGRPGLYCGLIIVFDISTGAPAAIMQDGYLQHLRVGAAAGIGTDLMARPDARTLGLLGSGGMAGSFLDAISKVRDLSEVSVYSPNRDHREQFARTAAARFGMTVTAVPSAEDAVRGHDIVATATSSMGPTFDAAWLEPGSHVTCVTRRELSEGLLERADRIVQLGLETIPRGVDIPMMEWKAGGFAAYLCGTPEQRSLVPAGRRAERGVYPTLTDVQAGRAAGRQGSDEVTVFINVGTQGVQFAAVAGRAAKLAREANLGKRIPTDWLLEDIRD